MPPIGPVSAAWDWPDAVVGLVLATCTCVLMLHAASRLRPESGRAGRVLRRVPDRVHLGLGLVLALVGTLLLRGHPFAQVLACASAAALTLAGTVPARHRPRVRTAVLHRQH